MDIPTCELCKWTLIGLSVSLSWVGAYLWVSWSQNRRALLVPSVPLLPSTPPPSQLPLPTPLAFARDCSAAQTNMRPPPSPPFPPWCLHAVIASSRSWRRCFTAIKWVWCTGTWRWVTGITLLRIFVICLCCGEKGGAGGLRVSYLCSLHMCKWNAACYIRRDNVTWQTGFGIVWFHSGSSKNADILSVTPHNAIQTQQSSRWSC